MTNVEFNSSKPKSNNSNALKFKRNLNREISRVNLAFAKALTGSGIYATGLKTIKSECNLATPEF